METVLSIIVPVYNTPLNLFHCCLESIHLQSIEEAEFLIIDDGSTEKWIRPLVESYKNVDSRFVYIPKKNTGVSDTRNLGIERSNGEYLMFVDSDDQLLPDACVNAINTIKSGCFDVAIMGVLSEQHSPIPFCRTLDEMEKQRLMYSTLAFSSLYSEHNIIIDSPWAKIFRSSIIKKNNIKFPKHLQRSEDAMFCLFYYECSNKIYVDNHAIYNYIDNSASTCHKCSDVSVKSLPLILKEEEDFIKRKKEYSDLYTTALVYRTRKGISECLSSYFLHPNNKTKKKILAKELKQLVESTTIRKYLSKIDRTHYRKRKHRVHFFLLKHKMYMGLFLFNRIISKIS